MGNKKDDKKKPDYRLPLIAAGVLCLALAGWLLYPAIVGTGSRQAPAPTPSPAQSVSASNTHGTGIPFVTATPAASAGDNLYRISIRGNVLYPGDYYVKKGSTLADAIQLAGGLADGAGTGELVMDKPLYDGEYIEIE